MSEKAGEQGKKEQKAQKDPWATWGAGCVGVRMCVCHMFLNRIHLAHTAAFYLSKPALITLPNALMSFHIKQTLLK